MISGGDVEVVSGVMKMMAALVALTLISSAIVMISPVIGQQQATTHAVVTGSGQAPVFEEKFELPDDDNARDGTQVIPVPDGEKTICVYVVAHDPNGASDINRVWMTVSNPNGDQVASGDTNDGSVQEMDYNEVINVTQEACDAGLINDSRRQEINEHIYNNEWRMWKFCFNLTNCDMPGNYTVIAKANDNNGNTGQITNTFEYLSIRALAIDFNTVDYGEIVPGVKKIVSGDENFGTSNAPTVRNRGNAPFKLKISATDMVGADDPNNKILATNLDARVYGVDASGNPTDEEKHLNNTGVVFSPIIDACTVEKIDFSLMQDVICQDEYTGTITLEPVQP